MDQALLDELLAIFREESAQSLDQLRSSLEAVVDHSDLASLDECLRLAHNLKGASATVGLDDFSALAHVLEDFFLGGVERAEVPENALLQSAFLGLSELERMARGGKATTTREQWRMELGVADTQSGDHIDADGASSGRGAAKLEPGPRFANVEGGRLEARPDPASSERGQETAGSRFVRVERARLDKLLRLSSDLLAQNGRLLTRGRQLRELTESLAELLPQGTAEEAAWRPLLDQFDTLADEERRDSVKSANLASGVSDAAKRMRLTRLDGALAGWRRVVADAGHRLDKEVRLRAELGDIEVDRHVLDRLNLPIIHLLRNAVAHGIESPDVRFQKGKPRRGDVFVGARQRGASIELWIQDDGAGVDLGRVGETAVRRGLLGEAEAAELTLTQATELLFQPGFSTTKAANRVSGRGVGLEDVRAALLELGGSVSISPVAGFPGGTRFELDFPVSVLSTRALVVFDDGQLHALPLHNVQRTERVVISELRKVGDNTVMPLSDGKLIEFRSLRQLLCGTAHEVDPGREVCDVIIVNLAEQEMAVAVDEVRGDDEVVIKPLPWNLAGRGRAGGICVLSDGSLALALEPRQFAWARGGVRRAAALPKAPPKVLVVDDSLTRRTLHCNLMKSAGYGVSSAADGARAWDMLQNERFDILVSDVQMPELDGFELTARIRRDPALARLPVVLVTGLTDATDEQRGLAVGANAYVRKQDFAQERLLQTVSALLQEAS